MKPSKRLRINIISESDFTVQNHGVHTAFIEMVASLRTVPELDVLVNSSADSDIIHIHTVGPYAVRRLFRKGRKVITAHLVPDSFVGSLIASRHWYSMARVYLAWVYNQADAVIAVSEHVASELRMLGVKAPIYVIPNTIDPGPFNTLQDQRDKARERMNVRPEDFVILTCGQVQPRKQVNTFLECARCLPDYHFIWVGGILFGRLTDSYQSMRRAMRSAPANVTFTGIIDRKEVVDYYRAADLFFLPSAQETFGIVVLEAAATGLALLLRDQEPYRTCFVDAYEKVTESQFVDAIRRFATDPVYLSLWSQKSKCMSSQFDSRIGLDSLLKVYAEVLREDYGALPSRLILPSRMQERL